MHHPLRSAGDDRLAELAQRGDEAAFRTIYERHHRAVLAFCRHMLGSHDEAEDAVQHTFIAAHRDLKRGGRSIALRPWLFAIARNRCISLLRVRREHVALDAVEPSTEGLATVVQRREDVRELLGDLTRLPEDQRAALLLSELSQLDHASIADVLGCRSEKVKALVFQARSSLGAMRDARATPCAEIRVQLASATGAQLRRGLLRRHLGVCAGCSAFQREVRRQRQLMALLLPVAPGALLSASAFGGASAGTGGGRLASLATSSATKLMVSLAIGGTVTGGGAAIAAQNPVRHGVAVQRSGAATPPPSLLAPAPERPLLLDGGGARH